MKPEYKLKLRENWKYLETNLEVDPIVEFCYQRQVLEMNDRERIKGEPSRPDRALKLLAILMSKPDDRGYEVLLEALCDTSVNQSHISQILRDTEVPVVEGEFNRVG